MDSQNILMNKILLNLNLAVNQSWIQILLHSHHS